MRHIVTGFLVGLAGTIAVYALAAAGLAAAFATPGCLPSAPVKVGSDVNLVIQQGAETNRATLTAKPPAVDQRKVPNIAVNATGQETSPELNVPTTPASPLDRQPAPASQPAGKGEENETTKDAKSAKSDPNPDP